MEVIAVRVAADIDRKNEESRIKNEIVGTWQVYNDGIHAGTFTIEINKETGQYKMTTINRRPTVTSLKGTTILYDGNHISLESGDNRAVLSKVGNNTNTFQGMMQSGAFRGQIIRWERIRYFSSLQTGIEP